MIVGIVCVICLVVILNKVGQRLLRARLQPVTIKTWAFVLGIAGWCLARPYVGEERPGSWFEKGDYTTEVDVSLFPEHSASTNYRLKAKVHASHYERVYDDDHGPSRVYWLKSVRFPNGGFVEFESQSLDIDRTSRMIDSSGRSWKVELVEKPSFLEQLLTSF